jgi:hypothetical protein
MSLARDTCCFKENARKHGTVEQLVGDLRPLNNLFLALGSIHSPGLAH